MNKIVQINTKSTTKLSHIRKLAVILITMLIKNKYRRRHRLLKIFYNKFFEGDSPNADVFDTCLTFYELEELTNLSKEMLIKEIDYLIEAKEINSEDIDHTLLYFITLKGRSVYHDRKYIYSGKKEFWNDSYDIIKTLSAVILLIIAIFTFIQNSIDIKQNKQEIEKLKNEVIQIKDSKK